MKGQKWKWVGTLKVRKRFGVGMKSNERFGKELKNKNLFVIQNHYVMYFCWWILVEKLRILKEDGSKVIFELVLKDKKRDLTE